MFRKIANTTVSLALLAGLGTGLAQQEAQDQIDALCASSPVSIEFWHGFTGGNLRATLENLTLEFNRQNEGDVCVRTVGQGNYTDLSTAILAASAAGNLPVMAMGYENNIATYLRADVVEDLDALGIETSHIYDNFLEGVRWDGVLYGVPFNKSVHLLYFNRDLLLEYDAELESAGIPANADGVRVPTTVEEFNTAGEVLRLMTGEPTYWFSPSDLATYEDWFFSMGGDYYDDAGNLVVNSDIGVAALQLLVDMSYDTEIARPITDGYINESFSLGTYGFSTDTSAGYTYYINNATFDVGIAPMPGSGDGNPGASVFQDTNLLVFTGASEAQKAVARDYINFLTSPAVNAVFSVNTGYAPLGDAATQEAVYQDYINENPDFQAIVDQLPYAQFEPNMAEWQQIRFDILGNAVVRAVLQETTPQQALDEAQAAVEALLAGETR